jgi:hypothetical protein
MCRKLAGHLTGFFPVTDGQNRSEGPLSCEVVRIQLVQAKYECKNYLVRLRQISSAQEAF